MALRKTMPTRAPEKARPEDVRVYSGRDGGYTSAPADRPVAGTPNGTKGRLR
ncbi:hypothetical protein [Streptomyces sp. NPDC048612]|uniref:hypothetical protein n=1 Tax=Streptomyces sp. NPDC048612 TaxID=3365579 RepID=UPI003718C104